MTSLHDKLQSGFTVGPVVRVGPHTFRFSANTRGKVNIEYGFGYGIQVQYKFSYDFNSREWTAAVGVGGDFIGAPLSIRGRPIQGSDGQLTGFFGFSLNNKGEWHIELSASLLAGRNGMTSDLALLEDVAKINIREINEFLRRALPDLPSTLPATPEASYGGQVYDLTNPEHVEALRQRGFLDPEYYPDANDLAVHDLRETGYYCFLPGTPILMADGTHKPIEQIRIGDLVLAFDPATQHGRGALAPSRVTRTFQNTTRTVLDLRGLRMTPGHVCLTAEGTFATIAAILAADGTLVLADGTPIRARTGARLASPEDALLRVAYTDPATGAPRQVTLRAGIPCAARRDADGTLRRYTLAEILAEAGHTALPDGRMRDASGEVFDACDWPAGATPLDRADQRAWIVIGPDGAPYTPDWVQGLEEEAGQEMAIGATTRRITAGPGAARFQPRLVGGTIGAMPTLGSAIGRMH